MQSSEITAIDADSSYNGSADSVISAQLQAPQTNKSTLNAPNNSKKRKFSASISPDKLQEATGAGAEETDAASCDADTITPTFPCEFRVGCRVRSRDLPPNDRENHEEHHNRFENHETIDQSKYESCYDCGLTFKGKYLLNHIRRIHKEEASTILPPKKQATSHRSTAPSKKTGINSSVNNQPTALVPIRTTENAQKISKAQTEEFCSSPLTASDSNETFPCEFHPDCTTISRDFNTKKRAEHRELHDRFKNRKSIDENKNESCNRCGLLFKGKYLNIHNKFMHKKVSTSSSASKKAGALLAYTQVESTQNSAKKRKKDSAFPSASGSSTVLNTSQASHDYPSCSICKNKKLTDSAQQKEHIDQHKRYLLLDIEAEDVDDCVCHECKLLFLLKNELIAHKKYHKEKAPQAQPEEASSVSSSFTPSCEGQAGAGHNG